MRGVSIDFVVPYMERHESVDFMRVLPALPYSAHDHAQSGGAYASAQFGEPSHAPSVQLRTQQARYVAAVRTIAKTGNYDAVHAHDWLTFEAGQVAKQQLDKPLIAHVHATEFDRAGAAVGNPLVHDIEYTTLCMADKIVAVSKATKAIIASKYAIPADKIDVLHNSINPAELEPLDAHNTYRYLQAMKAYGYKIVVSVGRLTIQKGLTHLLRAAGLVIAKNPKVLFLLAGTGEQYHELVGLSAELGIAKNVLFTGEFVRGKAWRDAYAIGDMFVLPSVSEPFGITPLEAIGYGTPVLISKQSGVGEVLWNALKFDYWDTERLADQIIAMATYPSLGSELHSRAFAEFNNLSWAKVASNCLALYSTLPMPGAGV